MEKLIIILIKFPMLEVQMQEKHLFFCWKDNKFISLKMNEMLNILLNKKDELRKETIYKKK